jgi:hypothetical protein
MAVQLAASLRSDTVLGLPICKPTPERMSCGSSPLPGAMHHIVVL